MFDDVYKGKTVLVTGHTGFKGSWLCIWLKELGANVVGYSLDPPSDPNNFNACHLNSHVTHIHGDIRNFTSVKKALEQHQPEFVFHLAAQALVRPSYRDPKQTFDTNVGGTVNILEAVRLTPGVKVLLNITSDKCYENREWIWGYRENDAMGGSDPYSASKGCSELVFSSYLRSFFNARVSARQIGAASCRAGNAIGGGDWGENRLIPDCIKALSTGHTIDIRNPLSIRPWQHVLELLSGYLWLGRRLREEPDVYSGSWNFGPGRSEKFTVADIADCLIQCWGSGKWHDTSDPKTVHEAAVLKLCCDKANNLLNWRNTLSMHQSVKLTTEWYKEFYKDPKLSDMHKYCVNQIQYYTSLAQAGRLPWAMNP
ncbi:MAG: CDP-glucose 4,6-dehydratase [Smithella sp. PtaU1.Bin162]|nr:MAG: CDP-glucose 4,6-dehydratase [Smithella sp. PtaU1.Bin162]